jgi:hypothetical protein
VNGDLDGDRKGAELMYSENTRNMIRMFDEMNEKEQLFFLEMMKRFKMSFDE